MRVISRRALLISIPGAGFAAMVSAQDVPEKAPNFWAKGNAEDERWRAHCRSKLMRLPTACLPISTNLNCGSKMRMSSLSKVEMSSCQPQAFGMQGGQLLMNRVDRDR